MMKKLVNIAKNIIKRSSSARMALLSAALILPMFLQAQINPLGDQYLINDFQVNPAIAGTKRYAPVTLTTRQQWVGFSKAPTTQAISFHNMVRAKNVRFTPRGYINKGERSFGNIGYGASAFNYSYGAISHTGINLVYAYHIFIGNGRMGFGVAPSLFQFRINKSGFILPDGDAYDPLIHDAVNESIILLDANVGTHYYDDFNYAGFSIIQLLHSTIQFGNFSFISMDRISENPDLGRAIYIYYGRYIPINPQLVVEPSAYLKANGTNGVSAHLNGLVHYMDLFTAGLSYRLQESMGVLAGVKLDNIEFRYMFEVPFTSKMPNNFTTHQVMVRLFVGQPIE
jgi:type IX secretion system PorP/SprF family membrane protein